MTRRTKPYTEEGIKRVKCCRCQKPAVHQWQACADKRTYRPVCLECDIALNKIVLEFMRIPNADKLIQQYREQWTRKFFNTSGNSQANAS